MKSRGKSKVRTKATNLDEHEKEDGCVFLCSPMYTTKLTTYCTPFSQPPVYQESRPQVHKILSSNSSAALHEPSPRHTILISPTRANPTHPVFILVKSTAKPVFQQATVRDELYAGYSALPEWVRLTLRLCRSGIRVFCGVLDSLLLRVCCTCCCTRAAELGKVGT